MRGCIVSGACNTSGNISVTVTANVAFLSVDAGGPYANIVDGQSRTLSGSCTYRSTACTTLTWQTATAMGGPFSSRTTGTLTPTYTATGPGVVWLRFSGCYSGVCADSSPVSLTVTPDPNLINVGAGPTYSVVDGNSVVLGGSCTYRGIACTSLT